MNLKSSLHKYVCTCIGVFFTAFTITVIVCSIIIRVYFVKKLRNQVYDYYDDESNETTSYDEYFEAKYKATVKLVDNIIVIKKRVEKLNKEQRIFNIDRFGPMRPNTFIIVIQVHDNIAFLKVLLASLEKVVGITNSLLIFCHDYYDSDINNIIREVSFAKRMQVFYPYSSQIYPKRFPGIDTKFCSGDFNCSDACTEFNSECFRNSNLVQQKHSWWWHMNFIFDHLTVTKNHLEPIVFLEENQFVLEDLLFMLKVLVALMPDNCPQCEIIRFGAHALNMSHFHVSYSNVIIEPWNPALLGTGLAFNQTVWKTIKNSSYHFCYFDDYRWDASLNYLSNQRPQGPLMVLTSEAPRVLQMELCDGSIAGCTLAKTIEDVQRFAKSVLRGLYPRNLIIIATDKKPQQVNASGEWKDVRDSALCMYFNNMN